MGNLKVYSELFRCNFEQWILISALGKLDMDKDKKNTLKHWLFKKMMCKVPVCMRTMTKF